MHSTTRQPGPAPRRPTSAGALPPADVGVPRGERRPEALPRGAPRGSAPAAGGEATLALLLLLGEPEGVLERIVPDDPLGVAAHVARELRRRALLLDAERVTRRAFALLARAAREWRGSPPLEAWLRARVLEAIEDVRRHEPRADAARERCAFEALSRGLGLAAGALREACARFNRLERRERLAFFGVLIDGRALTSVAEAVGLPLNDAARGVRRGLDLFRGAPPAAAGARRGTA